MVYSGLEAFIDIFTKTLVVYGVFRLEIKNKKIIFVAAYLINILISIFFEDIHNEVLFVVNCIFFLLVLYGKIYQRISAFIFTHLIIENIYMLIATFISLAFSIPMDDVTEGSGLKKIVSILIGLLIILVISFIRRNKERVIYIDMSFWQLLLLTVVFLVLTLQIAFTTYIVCGGVYESENSTMFQMWMSVFCLLSFIIFALYILSVRKRSILENKIIEVLKSEYEANRRYTDEMLRNNRDIRKRQHDFDNHINVIYQNIKNGNASKAESYIEDLRKMRMDNKKLIYSGNEIIDSIILSKINDEKYKKVRFSYEGKVPSDININDVDMCLMTANIIDNAFEAALKSENPEVKIKVSIYDNKLLYIIVENTISDVKPVNLAASSKESLWEHGYGITIVKETAEKYSGDISYEITEKMVRATLVLKI